MNLKLARLFLIVIIVPLSAFSWPNDLEVRDNSKLLASKSLSTAETIHSIKFRQVTSELKSETTAVIHVTIDNGEREREFDVVCTVWPDSLVLRTSIQAWYYNYSKTFTATIPLK